MAQVVSFAADQLGLRDQVQGLSLIQQAQRCLAELGSPLASTSSNGIVSGLPRISTRHVPKQVEAKPVYVGEVVDPELDALKRQLALEKERNALLAERERLEKEKAQRMERAVEAQRRQQQQEEERMAMIERKKVRTTDKALTVGGTIGFLCGGPVGMAIGMHVGDKWATKKIKERYPQPVRA